MSDNIKGYVVPLVPLIFSIVTLYYFIPTQIELTDDFAQRSLSPAFFPEVSAWIVAVLSFFLMVRNFSMPAHSNAKERTSLSPKEEVRVAIAFGIALFFAFCFSYIGFLPATFLSLVLYFLLQGIRGFVKLCCLSGGTTVLVYLFFQYVMKVHFPTGLWIR